MSRHRSAGRQNTQLNSAAVQVRAFVSLRLHALTLARSWTAIWQPQFNGPCKWGQTGDRVTLSKRWKRGSQSFAAMEASLEMARHQAASEFTTEMEGKIAERDDAEKRARATRLQLAQEWVQQQYETVGVEDAAGWLMPYVQFLFARRDKTFGNRVTIRNASHFINRLDDRTRDHVQDFTMLMIETIHKFRPQQDERGNVIPVYHWINAAFRND